MRFAPAARSARDVLSRQTAYTRPSDAALSTVDASGQRANTPEVPEVSESAGASGHGGSIPGVSGATSRSGRAFQHE